MKSLILTAFLLHIVAIGIYGQRAEFSHQGKLNDNGALANGNYDFEFKLFDAASGGTQIGSTVQRLNVAVANGIYAVSLDFGAGGLTGADRYLDIAVRTAGGGAFTPLTPRQQITSAPYAVRSLNAGTAATANGLDCVGCVTASQIASVNGGVVAGTIPVAALPAGSASYIQNQNASPQASTNFNISGSGTAGGRLSGNVVNAVTQFELGGVRVLSNAGNLNMFAGASAGAANTGELNSFFGSGAGANNSTGGNNAFFGARAGTTNSTAAGNSFFGADAGRLNSTGDANAFFGYEAGETNGVGSNNSFFGTGAGAFNTSGSFNSFVGTFAGGQNITGERNAFFGWGAGSLNANGLSNTFIGYQAGNTNTLGDNNTIIGKDADVGFNNLTYATTIGADSVAFASNTIVLGRSAGQDTVHIWGLLRVGLDGAGATDVCRNASTRLSTCSSSLRYKSGVETYSRGLDVVRRLRPITFDWINSGAHDLGFGAEEVAEVEPLLVTHNDKGEIEGVKYKQITTILVNAVKEQQSAIERQQKQIDELKSVICLLKPDANTCRN